MSHYWKADRYYRYAIDPVRVKQSGQKPIAEGISWQRLRSNRIIVSLLEDGSPRLRVQCTSEETPEPVVLEDLDLSKDGIEKYNIEILHRGLLFGVRFLCDGETKAERRFVMTLRNNDDARSFSFIVGKHINIQGGSSEDNQPHTGQPSQEIHDTIASFFPHSQLSSSSQKNFRRNRDPGNDTSHKNPNPVGEQRIFREAEQVRSAAHIPLIQSLNTDDNITFDLDTTSVDDLRNIFLRAVMSNEFRYLLDEVTQHFSAPVNNRRKKKRVSAG